MRLQQPNSGYNNNKNNNNNTGYNNSNDDDTTRSLTDRKTPIEKGRRTVKLCLPSFVCAIIIIRLDA